MSQHPSLRSSGKDKQQRSVLKRYERVKLLKDKEKWEEKDSVFGLPKVKIVRFKIKKEKAAAEGTEAADVAAAPGAASIAAPGTKAQVKAAAPAKGAGSKEGSKPGGEAKK